MPQHVCPQCDENVRSIVLPKGSEVQCRHCGALSITKEDNID